MYSYAFIYICITFIFEIKAWYHVAYSEVSVTTLEGATVAVVW